MANPGASPFGRSQLIRRSPPPTPSPRYNQEDEDRVEQPKRTEQELPAEVISTPEIQKWMTTIDSYLNEICTIVAEGKMNSDQKLRVTNICRRVSSGASQMTIVYQSLKQKTIVAHSTIQHLQAQQDLSLKMEQVKEIVEDKIKPDTSTSFADMVKKGTNKFIRPQNLSSVVILPSDKSKTSDDTKSLVQKIISPGELKLHVRALRKTRNGGVLISTESQGDIEKLKNSTKLVSSGLSVQEPTKRRPRITIVGIPSALTEKEVFECIFEQNIADKVQNCTKETFLSSIKLSHKSGKRDLTTCNYVLEVSASTRKFLINQGRIFVNWTSCPVRDFTLVTRCFNCQQFGHSAKFCRETSPTCSHCGDLGHEAKNCEKKSSSPNCATCKRFNRKCDHQTGDDNCPARKYAENRYLNSIDYEGA